MDNTTSFNICVDSDILKQCEAMYGELGVDLNTAINVFLNKSLCVGGFPFDVKSSRTRKQWQQCWKQNALPVIRL